MDDAFPTLLLTRPDAQSRDFLAECESLIGVRVPAVIAPVMQILDIGDVPDLQVYETILVTSSHAVRRLGGEGVLRGRRVLCVGDVTAELARGFGADAMAFGSDVSAILDRSEEIPGPCFYARGRHVRLDLAAELNSRGVVCDEAVVYDQVAQPLGRAGEAILAGDTPVVAPLFSARTAELLGRTLEIHAPLTVIAMSSGVADAWSGVGDIQVVEEPTSRAMSLAVARCF